MIPVAPGPNKSFDAFGADQAVCQQYAAAQTAPAVAAANSQAVGGTLLTTALGAGLGAAIGGGRGAAIGAASGATLGTVAGAERLRLRADVGAAAIRHFVRPVHGGPRQPGAGLLAAARRATLSGRPGPPPGPQARYPGGPPGPHPIRAARQGPQPYYGPPGYRRTGLSGSAGPAASGVLSPGAGVSVCGAAKRSAAKMA